MREIIYGCNSIVVADTKIVHSSIVTTWGSLWSLKFLTKVLLIYIDGENLSDSNWTCDTCVSWIIMIPMPSVSECKTYVWAVP